MASGRGVVVLHPRGSVAYEAALAAQEAGLLQRYVTTVYRGDQPPLSGLLPRALRERLDRELRRRWHADLDRDLVATRPVEHLLYQLARRMLPMPQALRVELEWAAARAFVRGSARWLGQGPRPGLVHAFEGAALEVMRAARQAGSLAVLDVASQHEDFVRVEAEEARRWGVPAQRGPAGIRRRIARERETADLLLAPTRMVRSLLVDAGVPTHRVVVLPYGADPAVFRPAPRPAGRGFRAVYAGHLNCRKGVGYLLAAWSRLGLPDAELVLVGNPDAAGQALLARHPGVGRTVANVPHREVADLLASADAFVFPSLAEGSPLAVYEAMAAGLPVVTTEAACGPVRHGIDGLVVAPGDAEALASAISFLHAHPLARRRMGGQARRRIQDGFTWRHYRMRLTSIYRHLLERRSGPLQPTWELL